ncbi:gluconolactonase [Corallococcus exiguus]|nr:gluconolactonase [Corallococcus exiguus]
MRFHRKVGVLALALASLTAWAEDSVDFSTRPTGTLEVVARFDGPGPSGIAITPDGRVFVGFPRHAEDHKGATLAELVRGTLVPFPNAAMSLPSNAPAAQRLLSVHGMTTDTKGNIWVIDDGKRAGIQGIPDGGAKVVGFNPTAREVIASVVIRAPALLPDSHLNDLRVDLTHGAKGTAYISDSSFGTSPALVVVDLATGRQRRVLATHPSTQPEQDFLVVLEGKPLRYDPKHPTFPVGGADGIALSTDSRRLYYAPLTSRRLYSILTNVVSDLDAPERTLSAAVRDEGEKGFADGLAMDAQDRLYITDGEHHSILRRWPDGHFDVVARDARIVWPDGIFATAGHVYVTLGQWNRLPSFNGGKDLREPPYLLMRAPLEATDPVDATRTKK